VAWAAAAGAICGCAGGHDAPAGDPVTIDEDSGRVDGTGLGDDLSAVRRALGPGTLDGDAPMEDEPPIPRLVDAPPGPARGGEITDPIRGVAIGYSPMY
jgi:hypothetical protein